VAALQYADSERMDRKSNTRFGKSPIEVHLVRRVAIRLSPKAELCGVGRSNREEVCP
jgi:hypothetical protein